MTDGKEHTLSPFTIKVCGAVLGGIAAKEVIKVAASFMDPYYWGDPYAHVLSSIGFAVGAYDFFTRGFPYQKAALVASVGLAAMGIQDLVQGFSSDIVAEKVGYSLAGLTTFAVAGLWTRLIHKGSKLYQAQEDFKAHVAEQERKSLEIQAQYLKRHLN